MLTRLFRCRRQQGAALLIILIVIGVGTTAVVLGALNKLNYQVARDKISADALARAKQALIGYAASHPALPGSLPCPDTNNDGLGDVAGTNCTAYIGRLPWKDLNLPDLRDGSGECLWYALSPMFRSALPAASRSAVSNPLNSNTAGQLTVYDKTAIAFPSPINPVVAIVFAPGPALSTQNRSGPTTTLCRGNNTAANYLDTASSINNATGNGTNSFIAAELSGSFNDKLIYITASQFFPAINKRVAAEIRGLGQPATSGLRAYYDNPANHVYPWAANAGSGGAPVASNASGMIPYSILSFPAATGTWLTNNDWFSTSLSSYTVSTNFQPGTTYSQQCGGGGAGCLTVNGYSYSQAQVTVGGTSAIVCTINAVVTTCPYP